MTRFPEIHQSMPPEPLSDQILEAIVLITAYCGLMYIIPIMAMVYLIRDRLFWTQWLGAIGTSSCILVPLLWACYNPAGGWFFLVPVVAPAAFASYLLYINAKRRIDRRKNPTNLIPFRARPTDIKHSEERPQVTDVG